MDNKNEYFAKYKDPRWQKMRLEVMQRDEFTCTICKSKEDTLNVHHRYYVWGNNPWEYPMEALTTLCETCHEHEEDYKYDMNVTLKILYNKGVTFQTIQNHLIKLL